METSHVWRTALGVAEQKAAVRTMCETKVRVSRSFGIGRSRRCADSPPRRDPIAGVVLARRDHTVM